MMPITTDFNTLRCGTCRYWCGKRRIYGTVIEYEQNEAGICSNYASAASQSDNIPSDNGACAFWESLE